MTISLKYEHGSLRQIGSIERGLAPHRLISAGHRAHLIAQEMEGQVFAVGRTNPRNGFCIQAANAYYLFVHRKYTAYRSFFRKFFQIVPSGCDVDHVFSRALANRIGIPYLLLAAVPKGANRSHGAAERRGLRKGGKIYLGKAFPLDERMFHKSLGRRLYARQSIANIQLGYALGEGHQFGLSLKQRGMWNIAFCIDAAESGKVSKELLRQI